MNNLVRLLCDDDGFPYDDPKWHLIDESMPDPATLCRGEYFGVGQSNCEFELKTVARGGITCAHCLTTIRLIKAVKL